MDGLGLIVGRFSFSSSVNGVEVICRIQSALNCVLNIGKWLDCAIKVRIKEIEKCWLAVSILSHAQS